jgi:DNA repair exonuclease SbcCD ATPase subunit
VSSEPVTGGPTTFVMEQFRVVEPGRLEVQGTWDGAHGVDLDQALLVLHVDDRVDHVEADVVRRTSRTWHAEFPWEGDPTAIRQAALEVDGRLEVELGSQPSMRRRLGRTTRPARSMAAHGAAEERPEPDGNIVSLHAARVAAQDQLAEAQEETEAAREEARRAREDADRERTRRQQEAERLHDALETLQRVADEALSADRGRIEAQAVEIQALREALAHTEADAADAQERYESLMGEYETERDTVRAALAEAERAAEAYRDEAGAARVRIADLEDAAARTGAEVAQLQEELEQGRKLVRRNVRDLERAGEELREARRMRDNLQGLEVALTDARRAGAAAAADAAGLRERLAAIREALAED